MTVAATGGVEGARPGGRAAHRAGQRVVQVDVAAVKSYNIPPVYRTRKSADVFRNVPVGAVL